MVVTGQAGSSQTDSEAESSSVVSLTISGHTESSRTVAATSDKLGQVPPPREKLKMRPRHIE